MFEDSCLFSISSFQCKQQTKSIKHKFSEVQGNTNKARNYSDI